MEPTKMTKEQALNFLSGLIGEMNEQDNRITATPYYYELRYRDGGECKPVDDRQNVFFTETAAKRYIVNNSYALPANTYTYVRHAFRNVEMQNLFESIGVLVGVPYERK